MPAPLNPNFWASILHDEDGAPISASNPLPVTVAGGAIGTQGESPLDTTVAAATIEPLPAPPVGTLRVTVQVTGGDSTTRVRIREAGGLPGTGRLLTLLGSTTYGGSGGAVFALEAENVAGPAATVHIDFEEA